MLLQSRQLEELKNLLLKARDFYSPELKEQVNKLIFYTFQLHSQLPQQQVKVLHLKQDGYITSLLNV